MVDFIHALFNPDLPFIRYALIAGILSSAAFGVIGTYVVVRRISSIAGAISHSVLAGIGFGLYLQVKHGIAWFTPLLGAVVAALLSALIIGLVSMYARQREDTVIGTIWAIGMAVGLMFLSRTPGYVEPMSYLFGNILIISKQDLVLIALLDGVVIALGLLFYNQLQAVSFDEEFSNVRGLNAGMYYMLILVLTAVTVVMLVTIVGIVMVIALLTLPAAVSGLFARRLWQMMLFSAAFCMLFTILGVGLSYIYDLPTGSTIILFAGAFYIVALLGKHLLKRKQKAAQLAKLKK
ncbi:MAG TPA: metal ABC transporter permease [Spirochaetia bacterium]|nr:metal ABC transporter permease [Spirochaetia bacterium]